MAATVQQPVSAQVGNAFVQQYYYILHQSPGLVHRFYHDISKVGRPEENGTISITTTMNDINEKIVSLNYDKYKTAITSVDAQESFDGGVHVLVTGYMVLTDDLIRHFAQTFFLAPQEKGYFVLNDMLRYVEDINHHVGSPGSTSDVEAPLTSEQEPSTVQENQISEQTIVLAEEVNGEEVYNSSNHGEVSAVEDEMPVPEVVNEVQGDSRMVVESNSKVEELPQKSYASIVMVRKEGTATFSSPAPAPQRSVPKSQEHQVNSALPPASAVETPVSSSNAIENDSSQEGEAEGYSIYIRGLPLNATHALVEDEFKRFGPIKSDGIQVRCNRNHGFSFGFGFVEFEVASAVQKAIEASPIMIGGRRAVVEEKRSTSSRANNRARLPAGRGSGFRNDGVQGRGNYGGSRGYSRGDVGGRIEFGNRGSNRGEFSNRGSDGYQRADNHGSNGGRMNRAGGMAKTMAPRVSASA
ncbi:nuclear transport factor 2-like isoform X2 [Cornus florida]|uniref:nuclear transport factor 2-like isoform X2 n=1 Tax=Cornus florida TaxID=4283 RepID=UPI00289DC437|nr:nuclear transport factor 2-like isoform X2 [Cornus florida]